MAESGLKKACFFLNLLILFFLADAASARSVANDSPAGVTLLAEEDTIMDVRLKEYSFFITPEFRFVLPDASVKLGLRQKIGDTQLDASTEYNYLYNKIRYDISYSLDFYLTYALSFYDIVSFEQVYQESKYIQRNKGLGFSVQTPKFFDIFLFREELKNDNYYFARLNEDPQPDAGTVIILKSWLEIDLEASPEPKRFRNRLALNFDKSIPSDLSYYNFIFFNVYFFREMRLEGGQSVSVRYDGGFLLDRNAVPIWQVYRLGGYERMMGYNYDEFEGHYMDFIRLKYETLLAEKINADFFWIRIDSLGLFVALDFGSAGTDYDVMNVSRYNASVGIGLSLDFTFRKRTPVRMVFSVAQAIRQGRLPVFYFIHEF